MSISSLPQVDETTLIRLRHTVASLKNTERNEGTVLVSLLLPAGANLAEAISLVRGEVAQAQNVKSKQTRNAVEAALGKVLAALQSYRKTPENGLAVYASDEAVTVIEPPLPLAQRLYRCDSRFVLEPVEELLVDPEEPVALLVVDHNNATLAHLHGRGYRIVKEFYGQAHGKMNVGGQSQQRFDRLRRGFIQEHYRNIEAQFRDLLPGVRRLILGGPGMSPEEFLKETDFSGKGITVEGPLSVGYTDEQGVKELMFKAMDLLQKNRAARGELAVTRFLESLAKEDGKAVYGPPQVEAALREGAVQKLLLSTTTLPPEEWLRLAEEYRSEVVWVEPDLENGAILKNAFYGAAAIRRWAPAAATSA